MNKPLVFINHSRSRELSERFPGRIGVFVNPSRTQPTHGLPIIIDNQRYAAWSTGKDWDETAFLACLDRYAGNPDVSSVVVPDRVGDAYSTFKEWEVWAPRIAAAGFKLALAVQDGMTPHSVKANADPDVIFVGGTTLWKRRTLWNWCQHFNRVHVGRVNYEKWLWNAHRCGAESTDGTGWFRGDKRQLAGLIRYLERSSAGLLPEQLELEFSKPA